jgi:acetyl esterase/lipase
MLGKFTKQLFLLQVFLLAVNAQGPASQNWPDGASTDYDIQANVTYAIANNTELKLDLYLPKDKSKPSPTLVLFHGGGWVDGAKERNVMYLLPYLSMGWTVVNVEYRIAKNSLAPAAVEDCRCALRWLTYKAKDYNIDTSKIVLTGTSAGGHLSLISAMLPVGNPFDRQCLTDNSTRWNSGTEPVIKVAAVVNLFGIADVADIVEGPNAKHYAMEWLGSRPDRLDLARQLSPVNSVRPGGPAIITLHGENDNVAPYAGAVKLHEALERAKVPNKLITIKGRGHGGFSRQEMIDGYAAIREFLRQNGIPEAR